MKRNIKLLLSFLVAFSLLISSSISVFANDNLKNYSSYLVSVETGEVLSEQVNQEDQFSISLQRQRNRGIGLDIISEIATSLARFNSTPWIASSSSNFLNNGQTSWVWSQANMPINYMTVQNESWYASSMAGSVFRDNPSGWLVGALSAYVDARPGFTLTRVYGGHYYSDPGWVPIRHSTYNQR